MLTILFSRSRPSPGAAFTSRRRSSTVVRIVYRQPRPKDLILDLEVVDLAGQLLPGGARQEIQNRVENPGHGGMVQGMVFLAMATFLYSAGTAREVILQFRSLVSRTAPPGFRLRDRWEAPEGRDPGLPTQAEGSDKTPKHTL